MILQNRNFSNHFGCTVVFAIVPLAPTIITSTAFLVLAAFCAQYQSVVTFISFYVLFGICIRTLTITISTSGILIVFGNGQELAESFSIRQIPRVISVCKFIAVQFQMLPSNQMIDSDYAPFQLAPKAFN